VPLFGRNEDLHRRLVVVDFLFPSTHFPVSFLPALGRILVHIISSIPTIQKTASTKERGSSSSTRHLDFLCIPQYSFFLIHKQAFATQHFIDWISEAPKPSSLSPSTFKESATHHFINTHHHPNDSTKQRKRIFIVGSSSCISPSLSLRSLHKLLSAHLIQQLHKDSIFLFMNLFLTVLSAESWGQPIRFLTQVSFSM
jgi:hypothetical protein